MKILSPALARPRRSFAILAFAAAGLAAAPAAHAVQCFSMFDTANRLLYQGTQTPVDLSQPVSQEMRSFFPNRYLVISFSQTCPDSGNLSDRTIDLNEASLRPRETSTTTRAHRRYRG